MGIMAKYPGSKGVMKPKSCTITIYPFILTAIMRHKIYN